MKRNRQTKSLHASGSRWLAYATAGAATALTGTTSAEAEIHYSGILNVRFNGEDRTSKSFQLPGGAKLLFQRSTWFRSVFLDYVELHGAAVSAAIRVTDSIRNAEKVSFGQPVSTGRFHPNPSYYNLLASGYGNDLLTGEFVDPGQGFVGFKFDVGNGGAIRLGADSDESNCKTQLHAQGLRLRRSRGPCYGRPNQLKP